LDKTTTFYAFDDAMSLVELSIIEDEGRVARAVDLLAGNYGYILKINETIVSQGRVSVDQSKHAVFTSSSDPSKTWEANITGGGITVISLSIPYDDNSGSVILRSLEPDKAASETPPSLDGDWVNPLGNHPAYNFTGSAYEHKNTSGFLSKGTFSLSGSIISFNPSDGANSNFKTPWSQSYIMIGDVFFIHEDRQHNFGPFLRPSGNPTGIEGIWRKSGGKHESLTFTKNLFGLTSDDNYLESGAFNLDDPGNITIKRRWTNDTKLPYTVSGNTLTVSGGSIPGIQGSYTKVVTLEGTWTNPYGGTQNPTYTFSGSNFTFSTGSQTWSGTFSVSGSTITFNRTSPSAESWSQHYEFWVDGYVHDGKNLVLEIQSDSRHYYGPFYRTTP
jgi:hypothetical protein